MKPDSVWHAKRLIKQAANSITLNMQVEGYPLGVDLSYWQGAVNFPKLASKVQYAYLRAGYGNDYFDTRCDEYRAGCKANGIQYGLYWYVKPGKSFKAHAESFLTKWMQDPGELPPCFDLEESGGLDKMGLESWLKKMYDYFNTVAHLDYAGVMTYTSAGFLDRAIGLTNWLKWTQLWVAHWTTAPQPLLPKEWSVPGFTWRNWQYSATGKGSDYGVSSRYVDLDRGKLGIAPPPPGGEMKYRVQVDSLKIREEPDVNAPMVGLRLKGEVVTPVDTIGDGMRSKSYWVKDVKGWSAAQWMGVEYMEPFV